MYTPLPLLFLFLFLTFSFTGLMHFTSRVVYHRHHKAKEEAEYDRHMDNVLPVVARRAKKQFALYISRNRSMYRAQQTTPTRLVTEYRERKYNQTGPKS